MSEHRTTTAEKARMASCYDFDKTLSPDDMQAFTLIPVSYTHLERAQF